MTRQERERFVRDKIHNTYSWDSWDGTIKAIVDKWESELDEADEQ